MLFIMLAIVATVFTLIDEHEPAIIIKFCQKAFDSAVGRNNI